MLYKSIPLIISAALVSACGGGSSSGTGGAVPGVAMPKSMSVVTANGGPGAAPKSAARGVDAARDATNPVTDYSTDPANTYVYDASMESLDTVNMILCLMEQTRASDMVNQGAYNALVNEDKCEQGQNQSDSGSTGQSSSGQVTEFSNWVIQSTRSSDSAPQVVRIWVPGSDDGSDPRDNQTILVEVTASEGVSASKPFGSFTLNFKGVVAEAGGPLPLGTELMRGSLSTVDNVQGQPQFSFMNVSGDNLPGVSGMDFASTEAANVILDDADGTGGVALTLRSVSWTDLGGPVTNTEAFAIAFDEDDLLRGVDNNGDDLSDAQVCKSRTDFDTQVWRYNLYHAADGSFNGRNVLGGDRVELNSGFPFTYDSDNDAADDAHGWVGYHGIWADGDAIADGTTITRFDYDNDSTSSYTVNASPGKLMRRSANTELLSSFQGDQFQFWGQHPTYNVHGQWLVTVDGNNDFLVTDAFSWGDNGPETSSTFDHDENPGTAEVAVAASLGFSNNENLWLWSDSLGGNVVYVHDDSVAAGSRTVSFYGEEIVSPADSALFPSGISSVTLYCYDRCLKGGLSQNDIDLASSDYDLYYVYAGTPFQYTLTSAGGKLTLTDDSNADAIVTTAGLDMSSIGNDWGINSGEMVTAPLASAAEPWAVYDETVTLRWETGSNDWNRLVTVTDAADVAATFDRPIQFNYTHSTANDANGSSSHDGKKLFLEYGGVGQLWGFPWVEDIETHRWYSAVTLDDGVTLTDGAGNTFLVKAVEMEQTLQDDIAGCTSLDVDTLFSDAALALPTVSDIGTVGFTLADKPAITTPPAVIEGDIQQ